jgi:hypothetical protein
VSWRLSAEGDGVAPVLRFLGLVGQDFLPSAGIAPMWGSLGPTRPVQQREQFHSIDDLVEAIRRFRHFILSQAELVKMGW